MTSRRPRSRRTRGTRGLSSYTGTAVLLLSAVVVLFVGWQLYMNQRETLDDRLCPTSGDRGLTVLLVDMTDPLAVPQQQDLLNQLEAVRNDVPKFGRLSLFRVAPTGERLLSDVFDVCNPGDGSDANNQTGNPQRDKERWEEGYSRPLDTAFGQLTKETGARASPILQSVQSVTLTTLNRPEAQGKPRRLVLISDLLQNTPEINFYDRVPTFDELRQMEAYQRTTVDLDGVEVEIWMLSRPGLSHLQNRELADLWTQIFVDQGAKVTRVYNVTG